MNKKTYSGLCDMIAAPSDDDRKLAVTFLEENYKDEDSFVLHTLGVILFMVNNSVINFESGEKEFINSNPLYARMLDIYENKICPSMTRITGKYYPERWCDFLAYVLYTYNPREENYTKTGIIKTIKKELKSSIFQTTTEEEELKAGSND